MIALFVDRAAERDVGVGEASGFEASGGGFGDWGGGAGGVAGTDFDEFFVDVVGELLFGGGTRGLGVGCSGGDENEKRCSEEKSEMLQIVARHARHCFMAAGGRAIASARDTLIAFDETAGKGAGATKGYWAVSLSWETDDAGGGSVLKRFG